MSGQRKGKLRFPSSDNFSLLKRTLAQSPKETPENEQDQLTYLTEQNRLLLGEVYRLHQILDMHGISNDGELLNETTSNTEVIS
jgi:hypothetical protein